MYNTPLLNAVDVSRIGKKIEKAKSIILTTHKQCDGDGLGAMLGLYHALKKSGKAVRAISVDAVPSKYSFLNIARNMDNFEGPHTPLEATDLVLIFDTNDNRMVAPLYSKLEEVCSQILFVDHHPILNHGPEPSPGSLIETKAASTGELAFFIIKYLGIRLDNKIAQAIYTSIAFDTQIFKYIRSSQTSHLIAAELLEFRIGSEEIHRRLFATHTPEKVKYLSKILGELEYYSENRIAVLELRSKDLKSHFLDMDETRDVIDMIMNITTLQAAALFREDGKDFYKLSLRSKGKIEVLTVAEHFGGGGHMFAAGAPINGKYSEIKVQVIEQLQQQLHNIANDSDEQEDSKLK